MASAPLILIQEDVEGGGKEENSGIENDFAYNNSVHNADIHIRMGFLRKVYGLLSVQLLLTVTVAVVFAACEPIKLFARENSWTLLLSFVLAIGVLIALHVKRRDHPTNLVLLALFTLMQAYIIAMIVSMYDTATVLEALFITLTVVIGLTGYTFQSKRDFSFLGLGLFTGLWILLLGGMMQIFIQSTAFELVLSIGGAAFFCVFIVFDTHMIMHKLSAEEYILATINLYLDIINLFLYVLRILAAAKQ